MARRKLPEIQVWHSYDEAFDIEADVKSNKFQIVINEDVKSLPEDLQKKVDENWDHACNKNPKMKDNPVLFLDSLLIEKDGIFTLQTNSRGFRYTFAFNRTLDFNNLKDALAEYHLLINSTHCHIVTKDNKILFGTKRNQFNQISGFSGFPNVDEDSIEIKGKKYLDIYKTIQNCLRPEIGYLVDTIDSIKAVGVVYVDTPGLRGTDSDYLIRLDETADNAQKRFEESSQFEKKLYVIDFEPKKLRDFIKVIYAEGKVMSRYALGCSYSIMKAEFGKTEADKHLRTIKSIGATISTLNKTDYFKKKK